MSKKITKTEVRQLLEGIRHSSKKPFIITFKKRSTGETRTMVARYTKYEGDRAYDFSQLGLTCVFDMEADQYRSVPLEGVSKVEYDGCVYEVR